MQEKSGGGGGGEGNNWVIKIFGATNSERRMHEATLGLGGLGCVCGGGLGDGGVRSCTPINI